MIGCISVVPFSREYERGRMFEVDTDLDRDGSMAPWSALRTRLAGMGWSIDTEDRLQHASPDVWIHLDAFGPIPARADPRRAIIMLFEPEVVAPYWYRQPGLSRHRIVFTHRADWVRRGAPFRYLYWPQTFGPEGTDGDRERDEFLVMINGRKYPAVRSRQLYSERERVAAWFARHSDIAIYGSGWDRSSVRHPIAALRTPALARAYRGQVQTKAEVLGRALFVLCFENMRSPGFRTEKLFDALAAGCIPVYLGDSEIQDAVPTDTFIDYSRVGGPRRLDRLLRSMTAERREELRAASQAYLGSPAFVPYTVNAFVDRMLDAISEVAPK